MRVDQIIDRFGDDVSVTWHAFLLRPDEKERDQAAFEAYTDSWARPAEAEPSITFTRWASGAPAPTGSLPAQVAAKAVDQIDPAGSPRFHRALMHGYFTDNRTISDWSVLAEIANECGIDGDAVISLVSESHHELSAAVIGEHNQAIEVGVTAVPTVVLDRVLPVQGAQEFRSYEQWISRLLERRSTSEA